MITGIHFRLEHMQTLQLHYMITLVGNSMFQQFNWSTGYTGENTLIIVLYFSGKLVKKSPSGAHQNETSTKLNPLKVGIIIEQNQVVKTDLPGPMSQRTNHFVSSLALWFAHVEFPPYWIGLMHLNFISNYTSDKFTRSCLLPQRNIIE